MVRTPEGFKEAYDRFVAGGWTGLAADPAHGGQGLPKAIKVVMDEMVCSANLAFSNYPGLSASAYLAIEAHAPDELKALYLPQLTAGALERHHVPDRAAVRHRPRPDPHPRRAQRRRHLRITGTKIFITSGEQDLTANIVHLVLARLPDAPKGTRGISLFLVPKLLPKADGTPGPATASCAPGSSTRWASTARRRAS